MLHFQGSILILIFKERIFKPKVRLIMEFQVSVSCWRVDILKAYHIGNRPLQGARSSLTGLCQSIVLSGLCFFHLALDC